MRRTSLVGAALLLAAGAACGAELAASLKALDAQPADLAPYRPAELTLTSAAAETIATVLLHPAGGGPMVRQAVTVPPGQTSRVRVALPAIWPVQEYRVRALGPAGRVVGAASAGITWPAELATTDQFIDDAYAPWRDARATWHAVTKRNAILLLGLLAIAAAATLFVRRPWLRTAAVAALAAAGAVAAWQAPAWPEVVETAEFHLELLRPEAPLAIDSFAVLAARRTTPIERRAYRIPYPVYPDRKAPLARAIEVNPAERTLRETLRPGQVRVLRPAKSRPWRSEATTIDMALRPAGGTWAVNTAFSYRPGFVVRNDVFWPLPPEVRAGRMPLPAEEAQPLWPLLSDPAGRGLTRNHARLLAYWRQKHQRAETFYLLGFLQRARHFVLIAAELRSATTSPAGLGRPSEGD